MTSPSHLATTPPVESLRRAFGQRFQIGAAVGGKLPDALGPGELSLLLQHFDGVTPENCMKPGPLQPEPGRYDFSLADAFMAFAEQHSLGVVGHCLCWHSQSPAWFFAPGMSRDAALAQLQGHIEAVAGRYRGRMQGWDVLFDRSCQAKPALRRVLATAEQRP